MEFDESAYERYNQYADGNFEWQEECLTKIRNKNNVIISSPTGSGKTRVFLEWAKAKQEKPIIITAPIKALSNQRYRELKEAGFVVGLETGDIKDVPNNCDFLCCTQEIYTNKYARKRNVTLVIDEFHYIFENPERARTYVDALKNSCAKNILLCSATLGDLNKLIEYVQNVSGRKFYTYENHTRLTSLLYEGGLDSDYIENALVVAFSRRNINDILDQLLRTRNKLGKRKSEAACKEIDELASKEEIRSDFVIEYAKYGLAGYFGAMLPKEKKFIEECFEKGIIDTVVGTDALALGVNFPVENVVFAQLAKVYDMPISKNMFEQLAGRAGRKGYYEEGHVFYCNDLTVSLEGYDAGTLYDELLDQPNESISIQLTPNIKDVLIGRTTIEEEARFISKYSTQKRDEREEYEKLKEIIKYIKEKAFKEAVEEIIHSTTLNSGNDDYVYDFEDVQDISENQDYEHSYNQSEYSYDMYYDENDRFEQYRETEETVKLRQKLMAKKDEYDQMISRVYFDEFTPEENCKIFVNILCGTSPDIILREYATEDNFYRMLQFRKYVMSLPKEYRQGLTKITDVIRKIDRSAIDGYREKVSLNAIAQVLQAEGRLSRENIIRELKYQEEELRREERSSAIDEELRIADHYGLEEY